MSALKLVSGRAGKRHDDTETPDGDADLSADFEELAADRAAAGLGQLTVGGYLAVRG